MYKDRYGITVVRDDKIRDRLSISRDNHGDEHIAVLLHIPEVAEHEHSHIELNKEQATVLRDWLDNWLNDDLDERWDQDMASTKLLQKLVKEQAKKSVKELEETLKDGSY